MKPFSLEEYLKNPSRMIVTRDGRKVTRVLCTDAKGLFPVAVLVESLDGISVIAKSYTSDGHYHVNGESQSDLYFATEKQEGWINVYLDAEDDGYVGTCIFKSKEEAENSGKIWRGYVTTLKIEWGN